MVMKLSLCVLAGAPLALQCPMTQAQLGPDSGVRIKESGISKVTVRPEVTSVDETRQASDMCKEKRLEHAIYVLKTYETKLIAQGIPCTKGKADIRRPPQIPHGKCDKGAKTKAVKNTRHLWSYCDKNGRYGLEVCDVDKHENCKPVPWYSTTFIPGFQPRPDEIPMSSNGNKLLSSPKDQ